MNRSTRRGFFKLGATALGSYVGYQVGKYVTGLGGGLEAAIIGFYNAGRDTLTEITGAAEKELDRSAKEVKSYLTSTQKDHQSLQQYWERTGLLDKKDSADLQHILENVEQYTKESDIKERLTRLKDRLLQRLTDLDKTLEQKQPQGLQRFNEWFSKQVKGEQQGSRKALEVYKERLNALVKVYDVNQDNKMAQSGLLKDTNSYFAQTQKEVMTKIDEYLLANKFGSPEEKEFFVQLKQVSKEDPSGRKLAEYLLNAGNYFTTLESSLQLNMLHKKLGGTLEQITNLQEALTKGIELKNTLRVASEKDLTNLRKQTEDLESYMSAKKKELETKGYNINYDLFPRLTKMKDGLLHVLDSLGVVGGVLGATAAGLITYNLANMALKDTTRRELITLRKENKGLKRLIKKHDPHKGIGGKL